MAAKPMPVTQRAAYAREAWELSEDIRFVIEDSGLSASSLARALWRADDKEMARRVESVVNASRPTRNRDWAARWQRTLAERRERSASADAA